MATERIQIPIDKFGRVVLPKPLRERLGLREGTALQVEETDEAILLRPVIPKAEVVDDGGWLVLKPSGKRQVPLEETLKAIEESREGRDRT